MATKGSEVPQKEPNSQKKNQNQLAKALRLEGPTGFAKADGKQYLATKGSEVPQKKDKQLKEKQKSASQSLKT